MTMLEIKDLSKSFRKKTVVRPLSLNLEPGVYGLLGPNGAGKTTFIRCLTNLYRFKGDVLWKEQSIKNNKHYMERVGYLPQKFGAYRELTAQENLEYFCVLKGISKKKREPEVEQVLRMVNLEEAADKKAKHLSGGMLRRLGIAQALLGNPEILVFDEPTAGLDPEERLRFKMLVSSLPKGKTILISTHIVEDVDALCDKILIMDQGEVAFNGTAKELETMAQGKTFECGEGELAALSGRRFIERRFEQGDEARYRFVAEERQSCQRAEPRIEDGYICVLENI